MILVLVCNLIADSAWSFEFELKLTYQVQWGNVKIAEAEAEWVFEEDSYVMSGAS